MNRKSPQAHASLLPLGTKMRGNDLEMYIVSKRSNGTQFWERYNGDRPSPNRHASSLPLKTELPGNDGFMYIVSKRSNNSKYWKKTEKKVAASKKQQLSKWYKEEYNNAKGKGNILISVCEPYTNLMGSFYSDNYKITEDFYKVLLKKPKYVRKKGVDGNAYIFGPVYNKKLYTKIGSHGNDGAQTGIIEITNITEDDIEDIQGDNKEYSRSKHSDKWSDIFFPEKGIFHDWDERSLLPIVRKEISERILFVGTTDGGDVGADVYAHFNTKGEIDSLIIDNYMVYKDEIDAEIAQREEDKSKNKKTKGSNKKKK
jgi:hypothetical protein